MLSAARAASRTTALVLLIASNAIPLVGVLLWGWSLFSILVMYWLESGVVGILNIPRIAIAEGREAPTETSSRGIVKAGMIPFFVLHYGIFWLVHGLFVLVMPLFVAAGSLSRDGGSDPFANVGPGISAEQVLIGFAGLVVYHVAAFYFTREESRRRSPTQQMFAPYGRVVVLHLTILFGAFLVFQTGQPIVYVALLVGLKTLIDLGVYLAEHRRGGATAAPTGTPIRRKG
jgi:hypothetical protein